MLAVACRTSAPQPARMRIPLSSSHLASCLHCITLLRISAHAGAASHPAAVPSQERGPQLAVNQVSGLQPHLLGERGRPLLPVNCSASWRWGCRSAGLAARPGRPSGRSSGHAGSSPGAARRRDLPAWAAGAGRDRSPRRWSRVEVPGEQVADYLAPASVTRAVAWLAAVRSPPIPAAAQAPAHLS